MKTLIFTIGIILISNAGFGQSEIIQSGRLGHGFKAFTVGKNVIQVESGYHQNFWKNRSTSIIHDFNTLLKYGIFDKLDILLSANYRHYYSNIGFGVEPHIGFFYPFQFGLKYKLLETKNKKFSFAGQAEILFPIKNSEKTRKDWKTNLSLTVHQKILKWLSVNVSFATQLNLEQSYDKVSYSSILFPFHISPKWGAMIEHFGTLSYKNKIFRYSKTEYFPGIGVGFYWAINENIMSDLSFGETDFNRRIKRYLGEIGFSYKINALNKNKN